MEKHGPLLASLKGKRCTNYSSSALC